MSNHKCPCAGLLLPSTKRAFSGSQLAVQGFLLLLQLLEDEDHSVRRASAECAGLALAAHGQEDCSFAAVPLIQQRVFAFVAGAFGEERIVVEQMLAWICR